MLFSDRSIWTMVHGIGLGGAGLLGLAAALFYLYAARSEGPAPAAAGGRAFAGVTAFSAGVLWLTVLAGTYIVFPPYRATPPEGLTDLAQFPRSLVLASPDTAWLHAFAMEVKEHVPWFAAMLATAAAFVSVRDRATYLTDRQLRGMVTVALSICFLLAAYTAVLGTFVNKVAPLQ